MNPKMRDEKVVSEKVADFKNRLDQLEKMVADGGLPRAAPTSRSPIARSRPRCSLRDQPGAGFRLQSARWTSETRGVVESRPDEALGEKRPRRDGRSAGRDAARGPLRIRRQVYSPKKARASGGDAPALVTTGGLATSRPLPPRTGHGFEHDEWREPNQVRGVAGDRGTNCVHRLVSARIGIKHPDEFMKNAINSSATPVDPMLSDADRSSFPLVAKNTRKDELTMSYLDRDGVLICWTNNAARARPCSCRMGTAPARECGKARWRRCRTAIM